ncbi:MAG: hypothetical protein OEY67_01945 [Gammaproteobacteria bacterium]|nr:hypothetical protein [Gammaproteobacteria bacterium]
MPFLVIRALMILVALFWLEKSAAANGEERLLVVISDNNSIYKKFTSTFQSVLNAHDFGLPVDVVTAWSYRRTPAEYLEKTLLVVSVGAKATEEVMRGNREIPLYATLIPRQAFKGITAQGQSGKPPNTKISAVFLDQPVSRQFNLIKLALPQVRRIGMFTGSSVTVPQNLAEEEAGKAGFSLVTEKLGQNYPLATAIDRIFRKSDILLVLPDPGIIDTKTASTILMSSYRYRRPVAAYSEAYVKAGALLAVYSTPEQIGRYTANQVLAMKKNHWILPEESYSTEYSIEVNHWLARSLGLTITTKHKLLRELKKLEQVD